MVMTWSGISNVSKNYYEVAKTLGADEKAVLVAAQGVKATGVLNPDTDPGRAGPKGVCAAKRRRIREDLFPYSFQKFER